MRMVKAKLIRRSGAGLTVNDDVPLGKIYDIDIDSKLTVSFPDLAALRWRTTVFVTVSNGKLFPLELLEVIDEPGFGKC